MNTIHPVLKTVIDRITERSQRTPRRYLHQTREAGDRGPARGRLACANLAAQFLVSPGSTPILLDAMTGTGLPPCPVWQPSRRSCPHSRPNTPS